MESLRDAMKGFDMGRIRELAAKAKASSHSSTSQGAAEYECKDCKDEEGELVRTASGEVWRPCNCVEKKRIARLIKASAITEEFARKKFKNFDLENVDEIIKEAHNAAYEYVKSFPTIRNSRHNSIALIGRPGTGKTHLLMAVSNNLMIRLRVGVIYFPWVEGFNEIKGDLDNLDERIHKLQQAEVLFIDDMWKGREKPSPFQIEQAFAIVNYRYLNNLPLLISSERSFAEMCEIDEAVGSRLKEMTRGNTVTIKGGIELNYRLRD